MHFGKCGGRDVSEFKKSNLVDNLHDCYSKSEFSNNFKLLELERLAVNDFRTNLKELQSILEIDKATGITLDQYGDMVGMERGSLTDDQYLIMIKAKIMQNLSNGSYPSVLNALSISFGCSPSEINIKESDDPCKVKAVSLPLSAIVNKGLSIEKTNQIIEQLLPVGIMLETYLYEGTFTF